MKPRVLYRGKGVTPAQSLKKAAESVKSLVLSLQVSFFSCFTAKFLHITGKSRSNIL